jgi:uncharacterized protein (DUF58 family)
MPECPAACGGEDSFQKSIMMEESEILKKVRKIEIITRRLVNQQVAGQYHSVFKGRGMSFEEVRPYQAGDEIRLIDWNVSARYGEPFVKVFVEERELSVILLVDASGTLEFGSNFQKKRELAAEVSALLAFSAIKNNDRVGLLMFTDRVEKFVPPKKGRSHVLRVIREILHFKPERRETKISSALDYMNNIVKRKSVVFLISDFIDSDYERSLTASHRRHDLIPIVVSDRLEEDIPDMGFVAVENPETGEILWFNSSSRKNRENFKKKSLEIRKNRETLFKKHSIDFINLNTGEPYTKPLLNYFRIRAKRF